MKASIITIGDELLIGQIINTNSAWLGAELTAAGFSVENHISISDSAEAIKKVLELHLPGNDLLIFTGGLGPTRDDITKRVLADYFGSRLIFSEEAFRDVEAVISKYGLSMNPKNRDQALFPDNAKLLHNHHGTAPGMWFEQDNKVIIGLPGVPGEMKGIYNDYLKSELVKYFSLPKIIYKTIMCTGIAESKLAIELSEWEKALDDSISLAYLPSPAHIRLRLGSSGSSRDEVEQRINKEIDSLWKIIPQYIYGYDNQSIEEVLGRMIEERGAKLTAAESCTGGAIAAGITAIPGCSNWYNGGVVAYSNEIKNKVLGVKAETLEKYGAVSGETVEEMARGACRLFNADYSVAVSGIAGPDGGTAEKPVGTVWIAAAGPDFLVKERFVFGKERGLNIIRSKAAALNMLRRAIIGNNG